MFIALKYTEKRGFSDIHRLGPSKRKGQNALGIPSILGGLSGFELELEPVRNEGDKLTIRRLPLGIADGVAKEALQRVQVSPVPGHFDGVADGPFYP